MASYGSGQERGTEDHTTIGGIMAARGGRARPGELNAFPYSVVGARRVASWRRGRGRVSHAVVDWRIMWLGCKVPEVGRR